MLTQAPLAWLEGHAAPKSLAEATRDTISRAIGRSLVTTARLITVPDIRWNGCKPSATQRIYFANHTSHGDFVVLWGSLPANLRKHTRPVAAGDYWTRGMIRRRLMEGVFHGVLIDREPAGVHRNPLGPILRALDAGESLIFFPEGTRGTGEHVRPFRCGIYHVARAHPAIELIPVWIDNLNRVLPRGAFLPVPLHCSMTFGTPARLNLGEAKPEFLARLRNSLVEMRPHANQS
jgi:1-acyl-sn-glycerol-3-phosphate acyltransferase